MFKKPKSLRLRLHPDPILKQQSTEVTPEELKEMRDLVMDMGRTMYENEGCGLAAIQVGVPKRLLVYDVSEEQDDLCALINPRVVSRSKKCETADEGCLSFPDLYEPIERATSVRVEGLDAKGKPVSIDAEDFLARVLQHEIDHLEGLTMLNRMDDELRQKALREYFGLESGEQSKASAHSGPEL
ncbi:MAG: peptide deformylase [Coriobacteriia bacterium]|nr:peptide deformylase [Coriobacteriia bacterium]